MLDDIVLFVEFDFAQKYDFYTFIFVCIPCRLFTSKPGLFGLMGGAANPTGVALVVILAVMVVCSMKWMRKGGYFEVSGENYVELWEHNFYFDESWRGNNWNFRGESNSFFYFSSVNKKALQVVFSVSTGDRDASSIAVI